jgi:hypothetical protein
MRIAERLMMDLRLDWLRRRLPHPPKWLDTFLDLAHHP